MNDLNTVGNSVGGMMADEAEVVAVDVDGVEVRKSSAIRFSRSVA